jgi:hypothetical protein
MLAFGKLANDGVKATFSSQPLGRVAAKESPEATGIIGAALAVRLPAFISRAVCREQVAQGRWMIATSTV